MENPKKNFIEIAEEINKINNHTAEESIIYINAAHFANHLFENTHINDKIKDICDEILKDNVVNYNDIPKIIELYNVIRDYIKYEKNDWIWINNYLSIIEIILMGILTPLLGNVSQHLILNIIKGCTKIIINTNEYYENNIKKKCC